MINKLLDIVASRVVKHGAQYYAFSIFALLGYVTPIFISSMRINYTEGLIALRVIAVSLCIPLFFVEYLPAKIKSRYVPIYWYIALLFCLPFLSTHTVIMTGGKEGWLLNMVLSLVLLTMLVDWASFIFLTIIGILLAYVTCILFYHNVLIDLPSYDIDLFAYICAFLIMSVFLVARKRDEMQADKMENIQLFSGAIAHEVNTPIAAIKLLAHTLSDLANDISANVTQNEKNQFCFNLEPYDFKMLLNDIPNDLVQKSDEAEKIVKALLMVLKGTTGNKVKEFSMSELLKSVINSFDDVKKSKITYKIQKDFVFAGPKEMIKHIISNLINNSFKHGGENVNIHILLNYNNLYCRDNGAGIDEERLKKIFKPFYTSSNEGHGIGLAFCNIVMKSIDGSISCNSEVGKYTEFTLSFPVKK